MIDSAVTGGMGATNGKHRIGNLAPVKSCPHLFPATGNPESYLHAHKHQ